MKILILTGCFGLGHIKCAESVKEMILQKNPEAAVIIIDLIDYLFPHLNKVIYGNFKLLVSRFHHIYNISTKIAGKYGKVPVNQSILSKLDSLMETVRPDLVIANLPACGQYFAAYAEARAVKIPFFVYITDITFHEEWVIPGASRYFVGDISTKDALILKGINPRKINVTGIPVSGRFTLNGKKDKEKILVMGGGLGQFSGEKDLLNSMNRQKNVKADLICGSNQKLYHFAKSKYKNIRVFGLTDQIPEMMNQASIVITKPGGITTFEAIRSQTPLFVISPKLEQEIGNAHFIEEKNIGKVLFSKDNIALEIEKFLFDEILLKRMRQNMQALSDSYEDANPINYLEVDS